MLLNLIFFISLGIKNIVAEFLTCLLQCIQELTCII